MTERAVGYVRVSSDQQVEGYSLDAQRRDIQEYAEQHGWELVRFYEDAGVSAYRNDIGGRPGLMSALEDAETYDILIVHEQSRLSRRLGVKIAILDTLRNAGARLDSVKEDVGDESAEGRLRSQFEGMLSEYQSAKIGEHTKKGQRERARQGLHTGPLPFGYVEGE